MKKEGKSPKANTLDNFISIKDSKKALNEYPSDIQKKLDTSDETDGNHSKKDSKKLKYKQEELSFEEKDTNEADSSRKRKRKSKTDESTCSSNDSDKTIIYESDISKKRSSKKKKKSCRDGKNNVDIDDSDDLQLLPQNPLPDVFINKRLGFYPDFISFSEEERYHFERHWVAYGGCVIKSIRSPDVDYLVHKNEIIDFRHMQYLKSKLHPNVRHVTKNWIVKCINDVVLYDTTKYAVFVDP